MRKIRKIYRFILDEPLSCVFSSCLSLLLIGTTLTVFAVIMSVNLLPKILRDSIESQTGFYINEHSLKYDIFSNTLTIYNLTLMNPTKYADEPFAIVPSIKIKANPFKLLLGKYELDELELDISQLTCLRQNFKDYNLDEFIKLSKKLFETNDGHLKKLSLNIENFSYEDVSASDVILWVSNAPIRYEAENIESLEKAIKEICELFDAQKADYMSKTLKQISEK